MFSLCAFAAQGSIEITSPRNEIRSKIVSWIERCYQLNGEVDFGYQELGVGNESRPRCGLMFSIPFSVDLTHTLTGSPEFSIAKQPGYDACEGHYQSSPNTSGSQYCSFAPQISPRTPGRKDAYLTIHYSGTFDTGNGPFYDSGDITWHFSANVLSHQPQCPKITKGSVIDGASQAIQEVIPLTGTEFEMFYSSRFAGQYVPDPTGFSLPPQPSFNRESWTLSVHHHFDPTNGTLFTGDGRVDSKKSLVDGTNFLIPNYNNDEIFVFDSTGKHLQTLTYLTGAIKYSFNYDSSDRLVSVQDAFGSQTTITRDSSGYISDITSPDGHITHFTVDTAGRLISAVNPKGETFSFTYKTGTDLLETFTKPGGQVSTLTYSSNGRLLKDLGHGGNFWQFSVSTNGTITMSSNLGRQTKYFGSAFETTPYGLLNTHHETSIAYSDSNSISSISRVPIDDQRFDSKFFRISRVYETVSNINKITDLNQTVNWPTGVTGPFAFSSILKTSTTNSKVATQLYTASSKTLLNSSPNGATQNIVYNSYEQPVSLQIGSDTPWTYSYDSRGRLTQVTQSSHGTQNFTYNSAGFLSSVTDALGRATGYGYDLAGRVTSIVLPNSQTIAVSYDFNGNQTSITPPSRPLHGMTLNAMELLATYAPPAIASVSTKDTTYTYNLDRQLTQITRPDGKVITNNYGAITGLLTSTVFPTGSTTYTYKANSDQFDVVSSETYSDTFTWYGYAVRTDLQRHAPSNALFGRTTFTYDNEHRRSARTLQGRLASPAYVRNYTYNNDDRPVQIGDETLTYEYPSGRLGTTTLGGVSDARTYDTYGNLASYTAIYTPTSGSPKTLYSYTLTRDVMNRIISKSESVAGVTHVYSYSYDSVGRLTQVLYDGNVRSSYSYDSNGNRTSGFSLGANFSATYDDQDRLLTYGVESFTHSANGDMVSAQGISSSRSYNFDAIGKLRGAVAATGPSMVYSYDGFGRLTNVVQDGSFKFHYIYETGDRVAAQTDLQGVIQKEYVYGVEHDHVPDYMIYNGSNLRIIKDHLGSPRLVVNVSNGGVVQRLDYSDSGVILTNSNECFQPFGFAGGIYYPEIKLLKFGARYYDAKIGRWLTKDPIRFNGRDTNLYNYVMGDPINWIDPSGLLFEDTIAEHTSPEEQGMMGAAMVGTGVGLIGGSKNPLAMFAGGLLCYEGTKNLKKAKDRAIPEAFPDFLRNLLNVNR